jgi:hypothetical protein
MTIALRTVDARFLAWSAAWSVLALLGFGLATAIIPNPIFGREIPPEPFAILTWIASAPLMGMVAATYTVPPPAAPVRELGETGTATRDGSFLGGLAGFGAFLAIGCPVCNKVALLLLGTGGAMSVWAPIQPIVGAASMALLAGTLLWRLRLRARGEACQV